MKVLFQFILYGVLVALAVASISRGRYSSPEHPGKCVVDGRVLSLGQEADVDKPACGLMSCERDGWVTFYDCSILGVADDGYELGDSVDPDALYPNCCERKVVRTA